MARTRLKVCCISSIDEARAAVAAGADALGLVARMPSGPGPIPDQVIREIAGRVPPPVATFLLTSEILPDAVIEHIAITGVNTVQLVDDAIGSEVWDALRSETPGVRVVQVIHVSDRSAIDRAMHAAAWVDALLLDSGNSAAVVRELGGTGRVHDWNVSREIVERSGVPVFLAGGINPANVSDAIRAVRPFGIDLCSGVRTAGRLDGVRLQRLLAAMREADA